MKVKYSGKWYEVAAVHYNFGAKYYEIYDEPENDPEHTDFVHHVEEVADDEGEMSVYKLTDKEYKDLLVKDLYARLPHGVMVHLVDDGFATVARLDRPTMDFIEDWEIKPYLRPVASMTEAEMDKLFDILHIDKDGKDDDWIKINDDLGIKFFLPTGRWMEEMDFALDYLRSIHIDIYNFIGKKMALEAPEGMYK